MRTDRGKDGWTDVMGLIGAFRDYADAPKKDTLRSKWAEGNTTAEIYVF
jgi:hypothetical protein